MWISTIRYFEALKTFYDENHFYLLDSTWFTFPSCTSHLRFFFSLPQPSNFNCQYFSLQMKNFWLTSHVYHNCLLIKSPWSDNGGCNAIFYLFPLFGSSKSVVWRGIVIYLFAIALTDVLLLSRLLFSMCDNLILIQLLPGKNATKHESNLRTHLILLKKEFYREARRACWNFTAWTKCGYMKGNWWREKQKRKFDFFVWNIFFLSSFLRNLL